MTSPAIRHGMRHGIALPASLLLATLTMASGCLLDAPSSDGGFTIEVIPRDDMPRADGIGVADIVVQVDEATEAYRAEVEIRVSSGGLGAGGQPEARLRAPAGGVISVPLTYGREPGPVEVEVRSDGFATVDRSLTLARSVPDRIAIGLDRTVLAAFDSPTELRIALAVANGAALPSWGAVVSLRACCAVDGEPGPCPAGRAPVNLPARARLEPAGDPIRVAVQALPLDPEGPDVLDGFIVAAIGDTTPPCIADPAGASAELSVTR